MAAEDYWTGTGYSEMGNSGIPEGYRPFDASLALGRDFSSPELPYAPWSGGDTFGVDYGEINPYAGGYGPTSSQGYSLGRGIAGMAGGSAAMSAIAGVPALAFGGLLAGFGGKKKKRGNVQRTDPMYQGHQFEPAEGFPAYYETAQEVRPGQKNVGDVGFQYQQPQQHGYDYNYTGGVSRPGSGQLANPSQQNYVGQREMEYGSFYNRDKGGIFDTFTV